jgi:hypothetical protein
MRTGHKKQTFWVLGGTLDTSNSGKNGKQKKAPKRGA